MRILQLCKKFPFPLKDGESIAVNTLSRSLQTAGGEITLLAMNTVKHFYDAGQLPPQLDFYKEVHTVRVDNRIKLWDAFLNLFTKESYHIERFVSPAFRDQLIDLLRNNEYEVVQLETLYLAPYIPYIRRYSDAIVALRAHNVEHEIWERISNNTHAVLRKWYLQHLTAKLKRYEAAQLNRADILVPISERDWARFRGLGARGVTAVTPIGIAPAAYRPDYRSFQAPATVSFIGSLDWLPNQEGLRWFLGKVWNQVKPATGLTLHIAGRNTPDWLHRSRMKNVVVHGEVADAVEFINGHSIMVVPLLSGSGMRAKILEGMALGKVVMTTRLGLEGIDAHHGREVLIADTPKEFAALLTRYAADPKKMEEIGRRARKFVVEHYDSEAIARRLAAVYASLMVEAF